MTQGTVKMVRTAIKASDLSLLTVARKMCSSTILRSKGTVSAPLRRTNESSSRSPRDPKALRQLE